MRDRVFAPLGMVDTDFYVPADKRHRFATQYMPDTETGELVILDRPDGWWSTPPKMPDANGWLVSTVDDLWVFASMLAAEGGELAVAESVRLMMIDRMTAEERAANRIFVGDHSGWGLMMRVPSADGSTGIPGGFGWEGGTGTSWRTDPVLGLTGILLTQRADNVARAERSRDRLLAGCLRCGATPDGYAAVTRTVGPQPRAQRRVRSPRGRVSATAARPSTPPNGAVSWRAGRTRTIIASPREWMNSTSDTSMMTSRRAQSIA